MAQDAETLPEHPDWFQVTLSSIGEAVIVTDATGRVTLINPVAQTLTGWSKDSAIGHND